MYSALSKKIIEEWFSQLSESEKVDPKLTELLSEMALQGNLNQAKNLSEAISDIEACYEDKAQDTDS